MTPESALMRVPDGTTRSRRPRTIAERRLHRRDPRPVDDLEYWNCLPLILPCCRPRVRVVAHTINNRQLTFITCFISQKIAQRTISLRNPARPSKSRMRRWCSSPERARLSLSSALGGSSHLVPGAWASRNVQGETEAIVIECVDRRAHVTVLCKLDDRRTQWRGRPGSLGCQGLATQGSLETVTENQIGRIDHQGIDRCQIVAWIRIGDVAADLDAGLDPTRGSSRHVDLNLKHRGQRSR